MNDSILQAIEKYRSEYQTNSGEAMSHNNLQCLIHQLLEGCGLQGIWGTPQKDIFWLDPRVSIIGEIKTKKDPQFNPYPPGLSDPDWGYIKDREQSLRGPHRSHRSWGNDGLAQLHLVMREEHARYGIFTNGKDFRIYEHEHCFSACCFTTAPIGKRCGFPEKQSILQCDLLVDKAEKIVSVLGFLRNVWEKSRFSWP